jgi:hypothetical protein
MVRWSRRLTQVFFLLFALQFVLVVVAVVVPTEWQMPTLTAAIVCIVAATVLVPITIWLDYRSGADPTGPRDALEVMIVCLLIGWPAIYLEKNHGYNWWLSAAGMALIVVPLWLLYLRANKRKADRTTS